MRKKYYENKPMVLSRNEEGSFENDLFGTGYKVEGLKHLLQSDFSTQNPMIAFYGEWGSGKTTILQTVESEINDIKFVFFHAWKYEFGNNLSLSLFDLFTECLKNEQGQLSQLIVSCIELCRTFLDFNKNIILNTSITTPGISCDVGNAGKETINEHRQRTELNSYYYQLKEFKEKFSIIVDKIMSKTKCNKLVVIIDDLERCEPNQMLYLISNIKHLFLLSEKVTFITAIDKKAVSEAIKSRYSNLIDPELYLEKLFDYTLTINNTSDMLLILNDFYFKLYPDKVNVVTRKRAIFKLKYFFTNLGFINPRSIKKVLNKYLIVKEVLREADDPQDNLNVSKMIFDIFTVILHDYAIEEFDELLKKREFSLNEIARGNYDICYKTPFGSAVVGRSNISENSVFLFEPKYYFIDDGYQHTRVEDDFDGKVDINLCYQKQLLFIAQFLTVDDIKSLSVPQPDTSKGRYEMLETNDLKLLINLIGNKYRMIKKYLMFLFSNKEIKYRFPIRDNAFSINERIVLLRKYL